MQTIDFHGGDVMEAPFPQVGMQFYECADNEQGVVIAVDTKRNEVVLRWHSDDTPKPTVNRWPIDEWRRRVCVTESAA